MNYILTLVSSPGHSDISASHIKEAGKIMDFYNFELVGKPRWLAKGRAVDLEISEKPQSALIAHFRDFLTKDKIDVFAVPLEGRRKKLLIADMDATIVEGETLDELADFAGIKDEIAAITKEAMEGRLDFKDALRQRVGLLKGLEAEKLQETLDKMRLSPGAEILVRTMAGNGACCILVSGGFTFFTEEIERRAGFHFHHGNRLEIKDNVLTGNVVEPILDKDSKLSFLKMYVEQEGLSQEDCLAIGDGANDIPMLKRAGLGMGYHPKAAVANEFDNLIIHGDLSAALYAQGYEQKEFHRAKGL